MKPALSIVIPCFNEQLAVPSVLSKLKSVIESTEFTNQFSAVQAIVVNDASTDDSQNALQNYEWIHLISHNERLGYGAALKSGFRLATGDYICFFDMDDSYDSQDILVLWSELQRQNSDVVFGNRLHQRQGMPYTRRIGNIFFSLLTQNLRGSEIQDVATGLRLFKKDFLKHVFLNENGLDYSLALTLRFLQVSQRVSETPIRYHSRIGDSKLNIISDGLRFLRTYRQLDSSHNSKQL
jgi:glycosyltransferase involved in cell wall biosynthesis